MRIIDVDAHLHEPLDWVERTDPELAAQLGPPARFIDVADAVFGVSNPAVSQLPPQQRPQKMWDTVLPGFVRHLEMTDVRQPDASKRAGRRSVLRSRGTPEGLRRRGHRRPVPESDVPGRIRSCRRLRARRRDLMPRIRQTLESLGDGHGARAHRSTDARHADRHERRAGIDRRNDAHARARQPQLRDQRIARRHRRVSDSDGHSPLARSITHPDFEPIWSAAEDLGMAAIAHVGFSRERIQFGWANNGSNDLTTYSLLSMVIAPQVGPQLLLGALAFDGVLERHPKLTVVVEEVGISWLPQLVGVLDHAVGRGDRIAAGRRRVPSGLCRPRVQAAARASSEYLQRQVRVTPLVVNEPLRPVLDQRAAGDAVLLQRLSARGGHGVRRCDLRAAVGGIARRGARDVLRGVAARIGL